MNIYENVAHGIIFISKLLYFTLGLSDEEDYEDDPMDFVVTPWKGNSFIGEFLKWMRSVDGKSRSLRQAKQHSMHVEVIMKDASSGQFDVECLFNRQLIRENWLQKIDKQRKPGTVKSYLYSLLHFYKFVLCDKPREFSEQIEKCSEMIVIIQNWISTYRKKCGKEHWTRELEELQKIITSEQIMKLDESVAVAAAKKILSKMWQTEPTLKEFTLARDYIMMYICIDNASRTGAIANMTINEFKNAKIQKGSYIVSVIDHKTIITSGPACLVLRAELYKETLNYFRQLRQSFVDLETQKGNEKPMKYNTLRCSSLNYFTTCPFGVQNHKIYICMRQE